LAALTVFRARNLAFLAIRDAFFVALDIFRPIAMGGLLSMEKGGSRCRPQGKNTSGLTRGQACSIHPTPPSHSGRMPADVFHGLIDDPRARGFEGLAVRPWQGLMDRV